MVAFHLRYSALPGGFLGVDVFFVISGFLITYLLVTEVRSAGRLRLGRFYARRVRRLLPSVWVLVAVVLLAGMLIWRDQRTTLLGGSLSSLTYVTNWWLISDHLSYFAAAGRPTMFQHLWSLAIEEQYYLLWPPLLLGLLRHGQGRRPNRVRLVILVALALAFLSTLLMAIYAHAEDLPYGGDTSRVYFGTDTHSMGLFLGSAGGAWFAWRRSRASVVAAPSPRVTNAAGAAALLIVVVTCFRVDEYAPMLYRGGYLLFDALVLVIVLCAVRAGSALGTALDARPLRWIGVRSYSIYLWHWPLCVITRPDLDVRGPSFLIDLARLILILGVSTAAYKFVELPLRARARSLLAQSGAEEDSGRHHVVTSSYGQHSIDANTGRHHIVVSPQPRSRRAERAKGRPRHGQTVFGTVPRPAAALAALTALAAIALLLAGFPARRQAAAQVSEVQAAPSSTAPSPAPHTVGHPAPTPGTKQVAEPAPSAVDPRPALSAFGDSVLLGAAPTLRTRIDLDDDAVVGRQAQDVLSDIRADAQAGRLNTFVLIHIGNNGIISPKQLSRTLDELRNRSRVVLVTVRVDRPWQDAVNRTIKSVGKQYSNVRVVDWHAASAGQASWFVKDGLHLTKAGAGAYSGLILDALR